MKRVCRSLISLLMCVLLFGVNTIMAEEELSLNVSHVFVKVGEEEEKNVLYQVMEIDSGLIAEMNFDVRIPETGTYSYRIVQYDAGNNKRYEIATSSSPVFTVNTAEFFPGIPVYLCVFDSKGKNIQNRLLTIRVNQGLVSQMVPEDGYPSEYEGNIEVDMEELLPGMKFSMYPYLIPATVKAYTDGRLIIGLGLNASNTSFWKDAYQGKIGPGATPDDLTKAFWGDSEKKSAVSGSNLGLLFDVSGYVQGNTNKKNEELEGELNVFIGTGFDATGQYAILTWEVTLTFGVNGIMDFKLKFDEEKSKYSDFSVEKFGIGFMDSLELYGGLGLSSIASIGLYGSGSIAGYTMFYPDPSVESLVLAGECGFKVKLFSRALFSFAIVSGSHEFVKKGVNGNGLLNFYQQDMLGEQLLAYNYASYAGIVDEPDDSGKWLMSDALNGYEERDFARKIAEDIYSDNRLQIVDTSVANMPQMNVVFLGSDGSRANGNRSRLMNFYFSEDRNFLSDPDWMLEDDGTADYDPYVYRSDNDNNAYVVWRNGTKAFDEDSTIEEIAANSDIWFAKHQVSRDWTSASRVTDLGSGEDRVFATGAKVFDGKDGSPVVAYYLNDVSDPLGLNESYSHDVCKASTEDAYSPWNNEKLFSVSGAITEMDASVFDGKETYAISYHETDGNGKKVYKLAMYQDGVKVFERSNAVNGRFVKYGSSNAMLTWFENNSLYGFSDTMGDGVHKITPDDMKVPTADYDISGRFASGSVVLTGTVSKDSTEKIYAIYSNDGGHKWTKTVLNEGEEFAYVNESTMAFTTENEPILFYSVQNYEINFDEERLNASNYVNSDASLSAVNGVQTLRLADDDPRFTDTQTDLYVRARKANQKVEIIGGSFDDEGGARKGKMIPFTLEIENKGLYELDHVTLFNDGVKLGDYEVDLAAGEKTEVKGEVLLPEECSDDGVVFRFGASSHANVIESEKDVTLGKGHIRVVYDHTLVYKKENLDYLITNEGYCTKDVYIYVYDDDTGEQIHSKQLSIPAGHTMNGTYSEGLEKLWRYNGHKNVKAYILIDGEQIENLDSTRTVSFASLEEIYIQDFSGLYKTSSPEPAPAPSGNSDAPVYDHEPIEGSYKLPVTYVSEKETGTAVKEEEKKTEEKPETETAQTPEPAAEQNETEEKAEETVPKKNRSFLGFIILAAALGISFLLFLLFGILRRREEEEE